MDSGKPLADRAQSGILRVSRIRTNGFLGRYDEAQTFPRWTLINREMKPFQMEVTERLASNAKNSELIAAARDFMKESTAPKYSYNFSWLGRPIIQYPQDIVAVQELIWSIQPDLII